MTFTIPDVRTPGQEVAWVSHDYTLFSGVVDQPYRGLTADRYDEPLLVEVRTVDGVDLDRCDRRLLVVERRVLMPVVAT